MKKPIIKKSIKIRASSEAVWKTLTQSDNIKEWTSAFMPGSYMEGIIAKDEEVSFKDSFQNGLQGVITECDPGKRLKIEYHTSLTAGVPNADDTKDWNGCYDLFVIKGRGGTTTLMIETMAPEKFVDTFPELWDKSLLKMKEIAER
jgi:uncharacterized protein YndB with AHSA1/START domain